MVFTEEDMREQLSKINVDYAPIFGNLIRLLERNFKMLWNFDFEIRILLSFAQCVQRYAKKVSRSKCARTERVTKVADDIQPIYVKQHAMTVGDQLIKLSNKFYFDLKRKHGQGKRLMALNREIWRDYMSIMNSIIRQREQMKLMEMKTKTAFSNAHVEVGSKSVAMQRKAEAMDLELRARAKDVQIREEFVDKWIHKYMAKLEQLEKERMVIDFEMALIFSKFCDRYQSVFKDSQHLLDHYQNNYNMAKMVEDFVKKHATPIQTRQVTSFNTQDSQALPAGPVVETAEEQ